MCVCLFLDVDALVDVLQFDFDVDVFLFNVNDMTLLSGQNLKNYTISYLTILYIYRYTVIHNMSDKIHLYHLSYSDPFDIRKRQIALSG